MQEVLVKLRREDVTEMEGRGILIILIGLPGVVAEHLLAELVTAWLEKKENSEEEQVDLEVLYA